MKRKGDFMFPRLKRETPGFRADYATPADFCEILQQDMKPLYRLAFLLTANDKEAEKCFTSTAGEAFKEKSAFKDWARSRAKRCLIKNAIRITSPVSAGGRKRNPWSERDESPGGNEFDAVTRLAPLERFVFVMSVLERYSTWNCSLLLGCSMKKVAQARQRALTALPGLGAHSPEAQSLRHLEVTAYARAIVSTQLQQTSFERSAS
jgi:DNA-directed RNA polymerase specialized sigma24 family protein